MRNLSFFSELDRKPVGLFADFDRDMERFFPRELRSEQEMFAPSLDLLDKESHYLISLDIPGVRREDIKVEVKNGLLVVEGERKSEHKNSDYVERSRGHFKRMVQLPEAVQEDEVEAMFENGVLSIALPKSQGSVSRKIEIKEEADKSGVWDRLLGFTQSKNSKDQKGQDIKAEGQKVSA